MAKEHDAVEGNIADQLQPLKDDDAFLTELSFGNDPSQGNDPVAGMLLGMKADIERQMPPAPLIEGAEEDPEVISLPQRQRRRAHPFLHGLVGAAAATALLVGTGAAVFTAGPGSPLYGMNQAVFGADEQPTDVVELSGTLDEMESRAAKGDMAGTRELLEEARRLLDATHGSGTHNSGSGNHVAPEQAPVPLPPAPKKEQAREVVTETATAMATETATQTVAAEPSAGPTVTEQQTVVVTETVQQNYTETVTVPAAPAPGQGEPGERGGGNPMPPGLGQGQ